MRCRALPVGSFWPVSPLRLFTLLNPAIGLVFALVFLLLWNQYRDRRHILLMSAAALAYVVAVLSQLFIPINPALGLNTMVSAVFYMACLVFFVEAMLMRVGVAGNMPWLLGLSALIVGLIAYFLYVHEDLTIRIYVLNLGCGALLVFAALRLRTAPERKPIDKVLFWILLLIGLHFLPRTMLTLLADGPAGIATLENYRGSLFYSVLNFALIIMALLLCLTFLLAIALDIIDDLRRERNQDGLTPLLNRRGFMEEAGRRLANLHSAPASIVFCDIDRFKAINDSHGHGMGDIVIREVGRLIETELRREDCAGRVGGEEFVLLLCATRLDAARGVAERLRRRIAELAIAPLAGKTITASFGVVEVGPDEPLDDAMERADEKLYQAKRRGRDRVEA